MKITLLGSGSWEGIPSAFCRCRVCTDALNNPQGKNHRARPQLLIQSKKGKFLIEISPDFRLQVERFKVPQVKDFLISHAHFDHLSGLHQLNSWIKYKLKEKPTLYVSQNTANAISSIYRRIPVAVRVLKPFEKIEMFDMKVTSLPLYHVFNADDGKKEEELNNEFGYLIEHKGKKFAYLGDYYKVGKKVLKLISGIDVVILDGTYFLQEIYPQKSEQVGLEDDPDHMHGKEILDLAKKINAKKTVIVNLGHLTELTHDELEKKVKGYHLSLGYDGMKIEL